MSSTRLANTRPAGVDSTPRLETDPWIRGCSNGACLWYLAPQGTRPASASASVAVVDASEYALQRPGLVLEKGRPGDGYPSDVAGDGNGDADGDEHDDAEKPPNMLCKAQAARRYSRVLICASWPDGEEDVPSPRERSASTDTPAAKMT